MSTSVPTLRYSLHWFARLISKSDAPDSANAVISTQSPIRLGLRVSIDGISVPMSDSPRKSCKV
jgi:hypothetical protein